VTGTQNGHTTVAFAVEISVETPEDNADFDPVAFGGEIVRDAIAGWGIPVVRIVHLSQPDKVFSG
jgi:serine protease inhibitor ecotin